MKRNNLPCELIEDILSRVPAKTVARLRSTSKQWNAVLTSESFAKAHSAANARKEALSIMLRDSRVFTLKVNLHGIHNNGAPSVTVAAKLYLKDPLYLSSHVDICNVFHCDGLLLCNTMDNRLVVWNPCSGETKWIKPKINYKDSDNYALGYHNKSSCKKYKILRIDCSSSQYGGYYQHGGYHRYEIYDSTSDSWMFFDTDTSWTLQARSISVKGNTYWVATDNTQAMGSAKTLVRFDYSKDIFENLSFPVNTFPISNATLSVVREEQLFVCCSYLHTAESDVWVTTRTGSVLSWSKFLTLKIDPEDALQHLTFMADEQNKVIVFCGINSAHQTVLHIMGKNKCIIVDPRGGDSTSRLCQPCLLNYVPSLAQIPQCNTS
ncbi:unnamed protein product [Microthlaspi erraticum]|uniref:F-box domain-containing protein n=1 Tax=Microthlaspi erraticum TaxID=1685480 RepID=A0A6D2HCL8_9BRAS|nr:unnamed protein product [Microthlaspi erraticum]